MRCVFDLLDAGVKCLLEITQGRRKLRHVPAHIHQLDEGLYRVLQVCQIIDRQVTQVGLFPLAIRFKFLVPTRSREGLDLKAVFEDQAGIVIQAKRPFKLAEFRV